MSTSRVVWALLLTSCTPEVLPFSIPVADETATVLLALELGENELQLVALDPSAPSPWHTEPGAIATVLLYNEQIDTLHLEFGPLRRASGSEPSRPIPASYERVLRATIKEGPTQWEDLDGLPESLAGFRLPAGGLPCLLQEGCLVLEGRTTECRTPCDYTPSTPEEPTPPSAPTAPSLPVLTPCPAGWSEVSTSTSVNLVHCEPWPAPPSCSENEAAFPSEADCVAIGPSCPAQGWATDLPTNRTILYVRAGNNGNGTEGDPFGRIGDAVSVATPETIIAVGPGRYDESIYLTEGLTIWGTCVAQTILATTNIDRNLIYLAGANTAVRNLRIEGGKRGVFAEIQGSSIHLENVLIYNTSSSSVLMTNSSTLTASRVVIKENQYRAISIWTGSRANLTDLAVIGGQTGLRAQGEGTTLVARNLLLHDLNDPGLYATSSASVSLFQIVIDGASAHGIRATGSLTSVSIEDGLIRNTGGADSGNGILAQEGAQLSVSRTSFFNNRSIGIAVGNPGSHADLADVVLVETQVRGSDGGLGYGFQAWDGASAVGARLFTSRNHAAELTVASSATATITDVTMVEPRQRPLDFKGNGVTVWSGGRLHLSRVSVSQAHFAGAQVYNEGSTLVVSDIVVHNPATALFRGFLVSDGGYLDLARAQIEGAGILGLSVWGRGTEALVRDVVVRGTPAVVEGDWGDGLRLQEGASATIERVHFDRTRNFGIQVFDPGTHLSASDVLVTDTGSDRLLVDGGGINVFRQAQVYLTRASFYRNRSRAIGVYQLGSILEGSDIAAVDTIDNECAEIDCDIDVFYVMGGVGFDASGESHLDVERFLISGNTRYGFHLGGDATADLSDGLIEKNAVGAELRVPYDLDRLSNRVRFQDNEIRLLLRGE